MATDYMKALMAQMGAGADQTIIPGTTKQVSSNIIADLGLFGGSKQQADAQPPAQTSQPPAQQTSSTPPAQTSTTPPAQTSNPAIKKVKITDDFGDEQEMEIDISNEEALREFALSKHKEKHISSELELIKQQLELERKRAKELQDKYGKLNTAKTPEEMADILLSGGLDALVKQKVAEAQEFEKLSPEAKAELVRRQDEAKRQKELDKARAELDEKLNKIKEAEGKANKEAELTLYRQATAKYCPNDPSKPELNKVHRLVWDEANAEIQKLKGEGVTITQALVDQKFQKAYLANKSLITSVRGQQTNSVVDATNKVMAGAATNAAGTNAGTSAVNESDLLNKWMGLMTSGKGGEVLAEINTNPAAYKPVYEKLIAKLRGR